MHVTSRVTSRLSGGADPSDLRFCNSQPHINIYCVTTNTELVKWPLGVAWCPEFGPKFQSEVSQFSEIPEFPWNAVWASWEAASIHAKTSWIRPSVSIEFRLATDRDRHKHGDTYGQGAGQYPSRIGLHAIASAVYCRSRSKSEYLYSTHRIRSYCIVYLSEAVCINKCLLFTFIVQTFLHHEAEKGTKFLLRASFLILVRN